MNDVTRLHREAMAFADEASAERRRGSPERSLELTRKAFELERAAAEGTKDRPELEPTRSVLHRSAASLALESGEFREAERLIARSLAGNPPEEIAEELRDLLEDVYFRRHLSLRGIVLQPEEFQISLEGPAVGFGLALTSSFWSRVRDIESLVYRTAERMRRLEFRENGPPAKELTKQLPFYISELRAASLAVSFRIGGPQLSLPGMDVSREMISELFDCVELFEAGNLEKLRERIEDESYFRNFVGLSEKIAPDGENIRRVGFTAVTADRERRVALSRTRERIRQAAKALKPAQPEEQLTEVCGVLLEANAKSMRQGRIQLVDDNRKTHRFVVPRGMMSDIVRPMFEQRIIVVAQPRGQRFLLQSIHQVDDETPV